MRSTHRRIGRFHGAGRARRALLLASALLSVAACSLMLGAPAFALSERGHVFGSFFSGSGAGELTAPTGVAVNEASGDVYVTDTANKRVEYFDATGKLLGTFKPSTPALAKPTGIAMDNSHAAGDASAGNVYVIDSTRIEKFTAAGVFIARITTGKEATEFGKPLGVAVDPTGQVWVDWSEGTITNYTNAEVNARVTPEEVIESAVGPLRPGLAVDSHNHLYVNYEPGEGYEGGAGETPCETTPCYTAELTTVASPEVGGPSPGEPVNSALDSGQLAGLGAQATNDSVYADETFAVAAYTPDGALIQRFGNGHIIQGAGLAVNTSSATVYVADKGGNRIDVFPPEPPGKPTVDDISVPRQTIATSTATLQALVDPVGAETAVTFEYGTSSCAAGGCASKPAANGPGAAFGDQSVEAAVTGLSEGTTYHYRVVATNAFGFDSKEGTFTTRGTFALADNRAWELVSPAVKEGASFEGIPKEGGLIQSSPDGSAVTFIATGPDEAEVEGNRSPTFQQILARRALTGSGSPEWSSKDISLPNEKAQGVYPFGEQEYQYFNADLSGALVQPLSIGPASQPPLSPEATEKTIYVAENVLGSCPSPPLTCFTPVVTPANDLTGTPFGGAPAPNRGIRFEAATPDLAHVVFSSEAPLTTEGEASGKNLYDWSRATRQLTLVNALPETGKAVTGARVGLKGRVVRGAISSDGSRIFWSTEEHLYLRDTAAGKTTQIDVPAAGVETGALPRPEFQVATSDGSRVFFTDQQRLTVGSTAASGNPDLYAYSTATGTLTDLTVDTNPEQHANVQGLVTGISEDGTSVYYVANGVLTTTENLRKQIAAPGTCANEGLSTATCSLYVSHFDATSGKWGTPVFVTPLSNEDFPDFEEPSRNLGAITSRVSPNGRYLAFMSDLSLTGYDNRDRNPGAHEARDEEVFLYDGNSGGLACASCDPSGERPLGVLDRESGGEGLGLLIDRIQAWVPAFGGRWLAANIPGWTFAEGLGEHAQQSRYLSNSGRLFFNSASPLVPQAFAATRQEKLTESGPLTTVGATNVYEYQPNGVGSCAGGSGCVALLSSGTSHQESAFLEASESGNDMFFLTNAPLVGQDKDTNYDVYDARACSESSPCVPPSPAAAVPCASGVSCKPGPPAQVPAFAGPATTAATSGNAPLSVGPPVVKGGKPKVKLTNKQLLAKALKVCHRLRKHHARTRCEARARKRYAKKKPHKATATQLTRAARSRT